MNKLLTLLLVCFAWSVLAQAPPIVRNSFTTNANPPVLVVVPTNGTYELEMGGIPLSIPSGLVLGGSNGAGTNNLVVTNFYRIQRELKFRNAGTGVAGFEMANSNSVYFFIPLLAADGGKTTNFAYYTCLVPNDFDNTVTPRLAFTVYKNGTGTSNVVLQCAYGSSSAANTATTGTFAHTNEVIGGTGDRITSFSFDTIGWSGITAGSNILIQVARIGDDAGDTTANIGLSQVILEYHRK